MNIVKISEQIMGMDEAQMVQTRQPVEWVDADVDPAIVQPFRLEQDLVGVGCALADPCLADLDMLNPRLFPAPKNEDAWMTKAVLGEQIWLRRTIPDIYAHHLTASRYLNLAGGLGVIVMAYGLWQLDLGWTCTGLIAILTTKLWFLDRMVWLRQDMRDGRDTTEEA